MDLGIEGKVALVSGGTHGIGLAIAKALAAEGCRVAVLARSDGKLCETDGVGGFYFSPFNALNPDSIHAAFLRVYDDCGPASICINNVGGGGRWGKWGPDGVENTDEKVWRDVYQKNAGAARQLTMAAIPGMRKQRWGRVVTVASIHGREGGGRPWFTMAKAAEIAMMKSLSMCPDLVRDGLTFNSVAPGGVMIDGTGWAETREKDPEGFARTVEALPAGRLGTPEEIAAAVVFLCSEPARWINGACVAVDGGEGRAL